MTTGLKTKTVLEQALPKRLVYPRVRFSDPTSAAENLTRGHVDATPLLTPQRLCQEQSGPVDVVEPPGGQGVPELEGAVPPQEGVLEECAAALEVG